jgi:hypothetical protein
LLSSIYVVNSAEDAINKGFAYLNADWRAYGEGNVWDLEGDKEKAKQNY